LKPVAWEISTGRTKFKLILFYAFPGVANRWFYRTISFNCPASGAGKFFLWDSTFKKRLIKFIRFVNKMQFANAAVNSAGRNHAKPVGSICIHGNLDIKIYMKLMLFSNCNNLLFPNAPKSGLNLRFGCFVRVAQNHLKLVKRSTGRRKLTGAG